MNGSQSSNGVSSISLEAIRPETAAKETAQGMEPLPREAAWALIMVGLVGLVVPGLIGTPFLLAGAAILVPGGWKILPRWAKDPSIRRIHRFLDDLEHRYPRR